MLVERLYRQARADRWLVPVARFGEALEASLERARATGVNPSGVARYLDTLHLEDLALACACAEGNERAWEHFVREQRPLLYRSADALEPGGGARDLADAIYADLFGLKEVAGERQSLFRYFHGRSSLGTWLRAVLAQRFVDRVRANRRLEPLPNDESLPTARTFDRATEPDRHRYLELMRRALAQAMARLPPRDRLRLGCYYAQGLTLARTGALMGEHEATCSRQLARTRSTIRKDVEQQLKRDARLSDAEIGHCFASVSADAGSLDLREMLSDDSERKESVVDRSR